MTRKGRWGMQLAPGLKLEVVSSYNGIHAFLVWQDFLFFEMPVGSA